MSDKQKILEVLTNINDSTSYEEILYKLYVNYRIEKGKTKTYEQVKEIISKW